MLSVNYTLKKKKGRMPTGKYGGRATVKKPPQSRLAYKRSSKDAKFGVGCSEKE